MKALGVEQRARRFAPPQLAEPFISISEQN